MFLTLKNLPNFSNGHFAGCTRILEAISGCYPPHVKGDEFKVANPDGADIHFHILIQGMCFTKHAHGLIIHLQGCSVKNAQFLG